VAFAGTVATSLKDWEANLRWFLPAHHDQYSVLVSDLVPAFIAIFQKMYPQTPPVIIQRDIRWEVASRNNLLTLCPTRFCSKGRTCHASSRCTRSTHPCDWLLQSRKANSNAEFERSSDRPNF